MISRRLTGRRSTRDIRDSAESSATGSTLALIGSRSGSVLSTSPEPGARGTPERSLSRRSEHLSARSSFYLCRPVGTPGTPGGDGPLQPVNTPHYESGGISKYTITIVALSIAVVFIAVTRKYGFLGGETLDFYNMSYVKDQVEGVKLSVAQLHTAKKDIEDVYTKMTDMLGSIKQLNEGKTVIEGEREAEGEPASKSPVSEEYTTAIATITEPETPEKEVEGIPNCGDESPPENEQIIEHEHENESNTDIDELEELVDYALESTGAEIVTTLKTQNYRDPNEVTFLGMTLCSKEKGPEMILQRTLLPGNCWAFKGQVGGVVIQLSVPIQVTGITIDHISRDFTSYELKSTPKEFSLFGINEDMQRTRPKLYYGRFIYDITLDSSQYFLIQKVTYPVEMVELRIHSNYGNTEYTCLYRVRIHGIPDATIDYDPEEPNDL